MKISVILPIYNQELYLDNIFDSLFSQTYDEYEIVAVNDGSTDSSRTILKKYEKDAEEINVTRKWPGEGTGNQQMKVEQSISLILLNKI